ncbi:MAG: penicillin-binding protein 2 [Acidobacteriota bacterium]
MSLARDHHSLIRRMSRLQLVAMLVFFGFVLQLWRLTVIDSTYYRELAERNRIKVVRLRAPRGPIVDRWGNPLAENVPSFNLYMTRENVQDLDRTIAFLVRRVGIPEAEVRERLEATRGYPAFQPLLVRQGLSLAEASVVLSHASDFPELQVLDEPRRFYPHGELAAHVLGYVGEISEEELQQPEHASRRLGDWIGKAGIEKVFDSQLSGRPGYVHQLVDSRGRVLGELERRPPETGDPLPLTLDLELQRVAEEALGERPGSVLAFDTRSGEVLALASRPAFDPNWFAARLRPDRWRELTGNPYRPLFNRATQAALSPGSIFKVVVALAALDAGVITPEWSVYCAGGTELYGRYFRCWFAGGHGRVNLYEAIRNSCNVYFYTLGQRLGIERIAAFAERLGLGQPTGIELPGEVPGIVPSPTWKRLHLGTPWYAGETISVAIGQGALTTTPAQLARAMAAVATGRLVDLHLVKGEQVRQRPLQLSSDHLAVIREAMWRVVNREGTGRAAAVTGFDVCGKTGTAQLVRRETWELLSDEKKQLFAPNAWFVGFAPRDNPWLAVAVIVQQGESGGHTAAPVAGKVFEAAFQLYGIEGRPTRSPLHLVEARPAGTLSASSGEAASPALREAQR